MFGAVLPLPLLSPVLTVLALQEANYPNLPSTQLGNPAPDTVLSALCSLLSAHLPIWPALLPWGKKAINPGVAVGR